MKNAKYHLIEAKIYKLTESSDTTSNSVSTSTWLCATCNMKSTSHKTWQTSLIFGTSPNIKPEEKKWEDMAYYIPPPEKVGGHIPRVPHQSAPMKIIGVLQGWSEFSKLCHKNFGWSKMLETCPKLN